MTMDTFKDAITYGLSISRGGRRIDPFDVFINHKEQTMQDPIEQEIQAKGLTAPRITPDAIEANVIDELYFTALDGYAGTQPGTADDYRYGRINSHVFGLLTFCVLVLKNGFTVTGESACASPENFDAEIGRKIARQNAVQKIWPLMGYELRTQLAKGE